MVVLNGFRVEFSDFHFFFSSSLFHFMFIFVLVLFVGGVLRPFLAEKLPASHLTVFLLIHFCSARTFTLTSFFSRLHRSYMNYVRTHYVTDEHIVRKMHRWKWCFSCIHEWNWTHFKKIARVLLCVCVSVCSKVDIRHAILFFHSWPFYKP